MTWRWMALGGVLTLRLCQSSQAFVPSSRSYGTAFTTELFAMNRKARRQQKKQQENRNTKRLRKVLEDDDDADELAKTAKDTSTATVTDDPVYLGGDDDEKVPDKKSTTKDSVTSGASTMADRVAEEKAKRPEVSQVYYDDDTGIEIIEQGQKVMDIVTRQAVKLSDMGPIYRLAQMFPGVPPDVREKLRFDWNTTPANEIIDLLREACFVKREDGTRGIPKMPSVANKAIDFVIANRDQLGHNMKRTLVRLMLRSQSQEDLDAARDYRDLAKHMFVLENHISAPFRQMMLDGEERIGPNFGNLDIKSYCGTEVYERAADYLVLKGMLAHWSQKYRDAEELEAIGEQTRENLIEIISTGDPKRLMRNNEIIWEKKDCEQILAMALKMTKSFVETPELFDDLPVEIRFLERASVIVDGTALRKFMVEEFCPAEEIEPAGLREGMRRLLQQLDNMQVDPYEDIWFVLNRICDALEQGTPDEPNPYEPILSGREDGPGYFQTYTFEVEKRSIIRFLDQRLDDPEDREIGVEDVAESMKGVFNFGGEIFGLPQPQQENAPDSDEEEKSNYKIPPLRANGRPHNLGWLDNLQDEEPDASVPIPEGRIIFEEEE